MTLALSTPSLNDWTVATMECVAELSAAIGFAGCTQAPNESLPTQSPSGAYIPLVGPKVSVQVSLQTTNQGCIDLGKTLLGMTDEDMTPEIVSDAVCEIANMLAGMVKRRMVHVDNGLRLGLPIFVNGSVHPGPGVTANRMLVYLDGIPVMVAVFQPRS